MARNEIDDAVKAKALLENEFLNKWWASADANLVNLLKEAKLSDSQRIFELKARLDALRDMQKDFKRYVNKPKETESKLGNRNRFLK